MSKYGWADDEPAFHIEKHEEGKVYGSQAVLKRLEELRKSLYRDAGKDAGNAERQDDWPLSSEE